MTHNEAIETIREVLSNHILYADESEIIKTYWHDFRKALAALEQLEAESEQSAGRVDYAIRRAHESFDRWNYCTGRTPKVQECYGEVLAEIEKVVRICARVVRGLRIRFDEDGRLIDDDERAEGT